jgi:transcriptional regulator with XRE-family HTH domain
LRNRSNGSRRPIQDSERSHLASLACALSDLRIAQGLSVRGLAAAAELSPSQLSRIERGLRRTRATTLARVAEALGQPDVLADLIRLAGPALAPESDYAERITRRRESRFRSERNRAASRSRDLVWATERAMRHQDGERQRTLRIATRVLARTDPFDLDAMKVALDFVKQALGALWRHAE